MYPKKKKNWSRNKLLNSKIIEDNKIVTEDKILTNKDKETTDIVKTFINKKKSLRDRIKIVDLNLKVETIIKYKLLNNCYRSKILFRYNADKLHKGFYIIKNVKDLLSEVKRGTCLVIINDRSYIYSYISKYDKTKQNLNIGIIDVGGNNIELVGNIFIEIILLPVEMNIYDNTENSNFVFTNKQVNTMCR